MSAPVLLNLLNELGKKIRCEAFAEHLIGFPPTSLINSIIQEHECNILFIIWQCNRILLANLHQNITISPLENAMFLGTSTHNVTT